jgi:hypothetical protein
MISQVELGKNKCRARSLNDLQYIYSGDQIEKNEMGGAYSKYGGQERCIQGYWWRNVRDGDHLEQPGIDGRIDLQEVGWRIMDWIYLAQDRERRQPLVNAVMNLRVP